MRIEIVFNKKRPEFIGFGIVADPQEHPIRVEKIYPIPQNKTSEHYHHFNAADLSETTSRVVILNGRFKL